ncbi:MAG: type II secretion system protein [Candidatus Sumerlaeia bacterium]
MRPRRATHGPLAAFTLLEVILAVTIFGLTMIALTAVMRTGARSWSVGHALSELMQTVRVSQDVVVRDLNNICYRNETDYNETFRNQIERVGAEVISRSPHDPLHPYRNFDSSMLSQFEPGARGRHDNTSSIFLDEITPPIDLSFRGTADRLSFVRRQSTSWGEAESAWGLRRITYYVKDKVLYREETDPFGFRPGAGLTGFVSSLNPEFNPLDLMDTGSYSRQTTAAPTSPLGQLTQFFASPDENAGEDRTGRGQYLPASIRYCEPVCEGVEKLTIAYGYFLEGQWVEVASWDSNAMQNRSPFDREYFQELYDKGMLNMSSIGMNLGKYGTQRDISSAPPASTNYNASSALPTNTMSTPMNTPDNLPGYVAMQVSVRSPSLKGSKMYTFTIFHSMPLAEETDVRIDEESLAGRMNENQSRYYDRKREKTSRYQTDRFDRHGSRSY